MNFFENMVSPVKFHALSRGTNRNRVKLWEKYVIKRFVWCDISVTSVDRIVMLWKKNFFSSMAQPIVMKFVMVMHL